MAAYEGNGGSIPFRVGANERRLDRIEEWRSNVVDPQRTQQHEQMKALSEEMRQLKAEVRGVRRSFTTFTVSIATSAVVFALTILSATGKL